MMTERDFCYWLQGMFELTDANQLSEQQVKQIKDHLKLVFTKVTPSYDRIAPIRYIDPFKVAC